VPREIDEINSIAVPKGYTTHEWLSMKKMWAWEAIKDFETKRIMGDAQLKDRFLTFLSQLLSPRLHGSSLPPTPLGFYDKGLIYYNSLERCYKCLTGPVEQALVEYYTRQLQLQPVLSEFNPTKRGILFADWVEKQIVAFSGSIQGFFLDSSQAIVHFPKIEERKLFQMKDIPINTHGLPCLYVPTAQNFACWDMIVHIPGTNTEELILIQVSLHGVRQHDYIPPKKGIDDTVQYLMENSTKRKPLKHYNIIESPQRSQIEQLIDGITGITGHFVDFTGGKFLVTAPQGRPAIKVTAVFFTAKSKTDILQEETLPNSAQAPKYKDLVIIDKGSCQKHLKIPF